MITAGEAVVLANTHQTRIYKETMAELAIRVNDACLSGLKRLRAGGFPPVIQSNPMKDALKNELKTLGYTVMITAEDSEAFIELSWG